MSRSAKRSGINKKKHVKRHRSRSSGSTGLEQRSLGITSKKKLYRGHRSRELKKSQRIKLGSPENIKEKQNGV